MKPDETEDERPPVFNRWRGWYLLVLGVALIQIIVYSLITYSFK